MLFRRLSLLPIALLATALLAGCGLDVADEVSTPTLVVATLTPVAGQHQLPSPTVGARPPATRPPRPVPTPGGSTGAMSGNDAEPQFDPACLDEINGLAPPDADPRITPVAQPIDLPQPYTPPGFDIDERLQQELDSVLGDSADEYAYFVKDLATGRAAVHNPGMVFNAASVFKLFVMYEVFHQQSLGLIDWQRELVVSPYYDAFALSPRVTQACQVITVAQAMQAMLSVSDNAAAVMLQDVVGASNVNAAIDALGVIDSGLFTDGLPLTAEDVALLLEAIARGEAVSTAASADMIDLMSQESIDNGLVSGVPAGTKVAHKTGNWSDATHDAGIVFGPNGPYVFVALSATNHETAVIRALSSTAYEYLEGKAP